MADSPGSECVIVDPGIGVLEGLDEVLREHRLKPVAVLLTHGHADHVFSVTPVCTGHDIPALIHPDDAYRLENPLRTLGPELVAMMERQFGRSAAWTPPSDVRTAVDGEVLTLAGLEVGIVHAPGHTEGSTMFALDGVPHSTSPEPLSRTLVSGDVLFAGSIGRTDLPGGDHGAMLRSLREKVLTQADDTLVLPGHGPATTIARERAQNPYLADL